MAKVKNFKDEKETIAIAKMPGHRKNRKVIESLPLDWSIKVHSKPNIESDSLCGKELPDDQHSCAGGARSFCIIKKRAELEAIKCTVSPQLSCLFRVSNSREPE